MKQVLITRIGGSSSAQFKTQEQADAFVAYHTEQENWGKRAYTIPSILDEQGVELSPAIDVSAEFTVEIIDISAQLEAEAQRQSKITTGKKAREACQSVLDLVAGYNLDRELTIQQITQMQSIFANAEASLRSGRPTYAKQFIVAIEADGVLVTQEMKDLCLELLEGY
jgi:hypothetical protein